MFKVPSDEALACKRFYDQIKDDPKFTISRDQQKIIHDQFLGAFSPVYDKWIQVRENFKIATIIQIVDEIFAGMQLPFEMPPGEYEALKRKAVRAVHHGIASDFNGTDATKNSFTRYTAGLLRIEMYQNSSDW